MQSLCYQRSNVWRTTVYSLAVCLFLKAILAFSNMTENEYDNPQILYISFILLSQELEIDTAFQTNHSLKGNHILLTDYLKTKT